MVAQAIATARAAGATGQILVRGDAATAPRGGAACPQRRCRFSLVLTKNRAVDAAIDAIDQDAVDSRALPGRGP